MRSLLQVDNLPEEVQDFLDRHPDAFLSRGMISVVVHVWEKEKTWGQWGEALCGQKLYFEEIKKPGVLCQNCIKAIKKRKEK
jgi:hypothetical protein